ncbi:MAG: cyclic nucleotide-binding domain-containing protein, partial [Sediminibacterium sp.]
MKQQAISNFKDYLSRSTKIPTDKFEELVCLLDYIELDKNQKLISSGKICDKMYFLADGLIKYEISQFNEQKLVHIATKGAFVADFFSYFSSQPAITNVYTIIPSQFLSAPKCALEDLYANCTIWSNF